MRYSYLISGTCEKDGEVGPFSLSVDVEATSSPEADEATASATAIEDLSNAGYSNIIVDKVHIQRVVSDGTLVNSETVSWADDGPTANQSI